MTPQEIFHKIATFLVERDRMVTLDKVVSETGIEESKAKESLESLAGSGLITRREVEDFDETCYQATSKTKEFCEKMARHKQVSKTNESERTADKPSSKDPLENYLIESKAPDDIVKRYRALIKEKDFFKKRSQVWEKHINEMVVNVTKELK